jgi:hypothetical protein
MQLAEHILACCTCCDWSGKLAELPDFYPDDLVGCGAEYCPNCGGPYVVYNLLEVEWEDVD